MDSWAPAEGMRSWHARAFLRLVLRQPPEGFQSAAAWAAWRCTAGCTNFVPGSGCAAVAHASICGEGNRRHHAYARAAREVLHRLPGRPQVRVEVPGLPAANCRMDAVVTGASIPPPPPPPPPTAAASPALTPPSGAADSRVLLVDFSVAEPLSSGALTRPSGASHSCPGVAAELRRREKEARYLSLLDADRQRLVPWVVETWGRHDAPLVEMLRGAAQLAAEERLAPSAPDDAAESRRIARIAASVFSTWMQRLSAGIVVAVAEHFDARFRPLRGTVSRQAFRSLVPSGLAGRCALDQGLLGVSGHLRSMEPRFSFVLPPAC